MRLLNGLFIAFRVLYIISGIVIVPGCIVFFFQGGWFIGSAYLAGLWALDDYHEGLHYAKTYGRDKSFKAGINQLLAQVTTPYSRPYVQRYGEQDIGDINGSFDLGYPVVTTLRPSQPYITCLGCDATYNVPHGNSHCQYCGDRLMANYRYR